MSSKTISNEWSYRNSFHSDISFIRTGWNIVAFHDKINKRGDLGMINPSKKLIAPIIITIILVLYLTAYLLALVFITMPLIVKIIGGLVLFGLIGISVFVLIERIKEIRSGEEDDLSKY